LVVGQFQDAARKSFADYGHTVPGFTDSSGVLTAAAQAAQDASITVDPHTLTPEDIGFMAFASKAVPAMRKEILRLSKENSALKGGNSTTIPGSPPATPKPNGDTPPPAGQTLTDRMKGQTFTFNPSLVG
jgi:hypothetical protein